MLKLERLEARETPTDLPFTDVLGVPPAASETIHLASAAVADGAVRGMQRAGGSVRFSAIQPGGMVETGTTVPVEVGCANTTQAAVTVVFTVSDAATGAHILSESFVVPAGATQTLGFDWQVGAAGTYTLTAACILGSTQSTVTAVSPP